MTDRAKSCQPSLTWSYKTAKISRREDDMKFSNPKIQGLCQQYHDLLAAREAREDRLRLVRECTYELEDLDLAGKG